MKSEHGKPASEGWRNSPEYDNNYELLFNKDISEEERILRMKKQQGELPELSEDDFRNYINYIRKTTGKP